MHLWRSKEKQLGVGEGSLKVEESRVKGQGGHLGDKAKRTAPVTCNPMCHTVMVKWMSAQLQEATSSMPQPIRREESKLQSVCSALSVSSWWTCHSCQEWESAPSTTVDSDTPFCKLRLLACCEVKRSSPVAALFLLAGFHSRNSPKAASFRSRCCVIDKVLVMSSG